MARDGSLQGPGARGGSVVLYSQSVALATERVHQKRFIAGSLIHLLFIPLEGVVYFIFPRNSMCQKCTTSKYSRPRLFRCNEKTAPTIFPQIAHDRGIVDPRTCANFLKKIRCRFCATGAGRKMRTGGCGGHVLKPNLLIRSKCMSVKQISRKCAFSTVTKK